MSKASQWIKKVIGDINYTQPEWMTKSGAKLNASPLGRKIGEANAWRKLNPRRARVSAASALVIAIGLWFGVSKYLAYLASLPKPDYVTVTINKPAAPDMVTGKASKLTIDFSRSSAKTTDLDKKTLNLISLTPELKGDWRWTTDRTLEFTPSSSASAQWDVGQTYEVKLSRDLFPSHVLLEKLEYDFETPQLSGSVSKNEFYQDPHDPGVKKAVFNISYNYVVDTEDLKKRITLTMQPKDDPVMGEKAKNISFSVTFDPLKHEAFILSESIPVPKNDAVIALEITEGARTARGGKAPKLGTQVEVPGMFELFKFTQPAATFARNEKYEPEQILVLNTKAPLASETIAKSLKIYLLPKKSLIEKDDKNVKFTQWGSPSEVTADERKRLEVVQFKLIPAGEEHSKAHTFKVDVPVGRFLLIEVPKGLKSFGGYELQNDYTAVTGFPDYPKELAIMSEGSLLSLSGEKKIPLLARNIKQAKFTLYRILPQQLNQFVLHGYENGGGYGHPQFYSVATESLSEVFTKDVTVPFTKASATEYFSLDLDPYFKAEGGKRGLFFINVRDDASGKSDQRMIVLTDLGLVEKTTVDEQHEIFVQNLHTGLAVAGADVQVIGANGLAVLTQKTNAEGRASFPNLKDFVREKQPIAFVVLKDGDLSFLPFNLSDRHLSYSRFDVGGLYETGDKDQMSAYLFSDRGIYRPGDTVNFGMMVRPRNTKQTFRNVPVTWAVTDARGTEIHREKINVSSNDLTSLSFKTEDTAATGNYEVQVFISRKNHGDEQIGNLTVRVEEFMPDRMRISSAISKQKPQGWVSPSELSGHVTLKNLFGTAAENRRVVGELLLTPIRPSFKAFKDFAFAALKGDEKPFTETLEAKQTGQTGEVDFDFDLSRFGQGLYSLRFNAQGFEAKGGRAVTASTQTLVSGNSYLIGLKAEGNLNYVKKSSNLGVQVIAIDSDLKKVAASEVKIVIVEKNYVSSLMQQPDGTYKYQSVLKEISADAKPFPISASGSKYVIPTDKPGEFAVVFKDKAENELNRISYSVAGSANITRSLEKNAELQVTLDKADYQPGSEIELQIKAPYTGAGLITIERDRVFASKWFKTSTTSTIEKIKIPEGVEGNAFVNVTFLRAPDSKEIFMSPLSYAVQPFSISLDSRKVELKIDAPALVKPGEKLRVKYSASKQTKLVLYGVDEGILQVAKYKLPDPLNYFFQRRALQVKNVTTLRFAAS